METLTYWSSASVSMPYFNSATTFRLWKHVVIEIKRKRVRINFNSATTFRLWKLKSIKTVRGRLGNFNSATTFRLWKHNFRGWVWHLRELLQFCHNLSVMETFSIAAPSKYPSPLQFCHNLSVMETINSVLKDAADGSNFNSATTFRLWKQLYLAKTDFGMTNFNSATTFRLWKLSRVNS